MAGTGGGRRWLKYGCFGCLGALALLVLFSAAVGGLAWFKASSEKLETHQSVHPLQVGANTPSEPPATPGAVIIEIEAQVQIEIEPGPENGPLRVEASYDTKSFELEEGLESGEGSGWTYRLNFRRTGSSWLGGVSRLFGGSQPRLRIQLPADVPMTLALMMSEGGAEARFGGLWLTSADIEVRRGGIHLEFDKPMREPMDSLSIRAAMGGFNMERVGNASPRRLDIDCRMGGGLIDLEGAWLADSEISIRAIMGGAALRLPRNVHIVGLETSRILRTKDPEVPLPTLTFSITTELGGNVDVIE